MSRSPSVVLSCIASRSVPSTSQLSRGPTLIFDIVVLVLALVASLLSGREHDGAELLLKALAISISVVISFGLWFWALDRRGPVRQRQHDPLPPDFLFPPMDEPRLAPPDWHPALLDYLHVESAVSATTLLLVAARAVNILA